MCQTLSELICVGLVVSVCFLIADCHSHGSHAAERATSFHDNKVVQDPEHIAEHMEGVADIDAENMTSEELEFHYFKLHDFDNNTKLDGLEIYKAFTHLLPPDEVDLDGEYTIDTKGKTEEQIKREREKKNLKYFEDIVDGILREDDIDNDGYLSYTEYVIARRREELREAHRKGDL